jgi:hypothetical protein
MNKTFTMAMVVTACIGVMAMLLVCGVTLYAVKSTTITTTGSSLILTLTTVLVGVMSSMFASLFTLITKETGIVLPSFKKDTVQTKDPKIAAIAPETKEEITVAI